MFGFNFGGMPGGGGGGFRTFHGQMPGGGASPQPDKEVDTSKFYKVLGVDKDASTSAIKKAYLKLARKEHPDKGGDPERFKEIQHAYDVLGDEQKRKLYDQGGEDAVESGGARGDASDIFDMFFGGGRRRGPRKAEPQVLPIRVSLEDLYVGKTVRLQAPRTVIEKDDNGDVMDQTGQRYRKREERKVLTVHIDKGMRDNHKITFEGDGNVMPGQEPGDIVFVVKTKEHPVFKRSGADLIMEKEISLYEALTGVSMVVDHLDGHKVHITSKPGEVVAPDSLKQVEDEGMPIYGNTVVKGCLFVKFEVKFPDHLSISESQKKALAGILGGVPKPVSLPDDEHVEERQLEELDREARRARERIGQDAYNSDEDEGPGMGGSGVQQVQCAQQ